MKTGVLIFIVGVCLLACKGRNNVPRPILQPEKMQAVLWDMVKADQYLTNYAMNIDPESDKTTESIKLFQQVLRIHNISKEKFKKSFVYYRTHPGILNIVLDSINTRSYNTPVEIVRPKPEIRTP